MELSAEMGWRQSRHLGQVRHNQRLGIASIGQVLGPEQMTRRRELCHGPSIANRGHDGQGTNRSGEPSRRT